MITRKTSAFQPSGLVKWILTLVFIIVCFDIFKAALAKSG